MDKTTGFSYYTRIELMLLMKPLKVNLLEGAKMGRPEKVRRFSLWKWGLLALAGLVILVPVFFSVASVRVLQAAAGLNPLKPASEQVSIFEEVRRLVSNSDKTLKGEDRDRINLLVTGIGGEGHDGPNLTDTMLFVSFQPSTGQVGILSIPRDLWVQYPGYGLTRINNINAFAEAANQGSGGVATRDVVSSVLGQPIDYYVRLDFAAFKTMIDDVGGVTINVDQDFVDYAYPTDNNLYQTVRFEKGWQTMNGDRALIYARSRHGDNGEGGDFARSKRQQKVIAALKDKLLSFDTLLNPSRIASVLETLRTHVATDLELWEVAKLAQYARKIDTSKVINHVLDDSPNGPLYATTIAVSNGDAYALLPRRDDWSDLQRIARDLLDPTKQPAQMAAAREPLKIEVLNGTDRVGLAQKTSDLLTKTGYNVVRVGNAPDRNVERTIIYDQTNGTEPEALSTLKNLLNADVSETLSGYIATGLTPSNVTIAPAVESASGTDFTVVIGRNAS